MREAHYAEVHTCRAQRRLDGSWVARLPLLAFALFVLGYLAGFAFVENISDAPQFQAVPQFDFWAVLMGGVVGLALASVAGTLVWLAGIVKVSDGVRRGQLLAWAGVALLVLATPLAVLFLGNDQAAASLDQSVAKATRPVTLVAGLCQLPGLMVFLALRHVAQAEHLWQESGECAIRLMLRLRADLRRVLIVLGAFLTLLVVTTGMRRQAFLALDPDTATPREGVLLYGLLFAVLLGGFYVSAASVINERSEALLDRYTPMTDPASDDFVGSLSRRRALSEVIGGGNSWQTFQATVLIAAPLLTALVGSALS